MTVDQMLTEIAQVYPTPKWKLHVDGMPDRQVIAIYMSMKRKGRFNKKKNRKKTGEVLCEQLTIFGLLKEQGESIND